jgi:hypothetical protein
MDFDYSGGVMGKRAKNPGFSSKDSEIEQKRRSAEEQKCGRAEAQLTSGLLDFWASGLILFSVFCFLSSVFCLLSHRRTVAEHSTVVTNEVSHDRSSTSLIPRLSVRYANPQIQI